MPISDFTPNAAKTQERWGDLAALYTHEGLLPCPSFACRFFADCDNAFRSCSGGTGIPEASRGCASYLGPWFDLVENATNSQLRVVVIGIDHGILATDLGGRRDSVPEGTNPQMTGVAKILQSLLVEDRTNYEVLKCYAMPNALKCGGGRVTWTRPREMFSNCSRHLAREFGILEPNLVITQSQTMVFETLRRQFGESSFRLVENHKHADCYALKYVGHHGQMNECFVVNSPHPRAAGPFYGRFLPHFAEHLAPRLRARLGLRH